MKDDRPEIHAMVAWLTPETGFLSKPKVMSLEEAVDFSRMGFIVLVDPGDESDLVRWEQWQRGVVRKRPNWWKE